MVDVLVGRRAVLAALVAGLFTVGANARAASGIPVRVRIIKGSREGPPAVDPKLADVQGQLSRLAYQRWEQAGEQQGTIEIGKKMTVPIPGGTRLDLTVTESSKDTVTFRLEVPGRAQSRLTISKDQRIVHQVVDEQGGAAYFATIRPWP
jgi:hypothetical protein